MNVRTSVSYTHLDVYKRQGMVAAFTYGFPVAIEAFKEAKVNLVTPVSYTHLFSGNWPEPRH